MPPFYSTLPSPGSRLSRPPNIHSLVIPQPPLRQKLLPSSQPIIPQSLGPLTLFHIHDPFFTPDHLSPLSFHLPTPSKSLPASQRTIPQRLPPLPSLPIHTPVIPASFPPNIPVSRFYRCPTRYLSAPTPSPVPLLPWPAPGSPPVSGQTWKSDSSAHAPR